MIWLILILIFVVWLVWFVAFKVKRLKLDCVSLITGGVKTGKTTLSVHLAIKKWKSNHRKWWLKRYLLNRKNEEEPLLYSNIPLTIEYVPVTQEMLERKQRLNYKSVMYLCETSLIADSMSFKDELLNERLSLFIKLYGHETRGGSLFLDTQAVSDNHYAVKRCISRNLYIYHLTKWIPFFLVFKVRELYYSEDNSTINVVEEDLEDSMKLVICSKRVWKKFDCYAYSVFTDDCPRDCEIEPYNPQRNLKVNGLVTFKKYKTLKIPSNSLNLARKEENKENDNRK